MYYTNQNLEINNPDKFVFKSHFSANKVHYNKMQDHMRENEVSEGAFGANAWELGFVLRIHLDTKIC